MLINIIWWRIQHNLAKNAAHSRLQNRTRKPGRGQVVTSAAKETMLASKSNGEPTVKQEINENRCDAKREKDLRHENVPTKELTGQQ